MRKSIFILFLLALVFFSNAQTGYKTISVSTGLSSTNSKYLSLTLEHTDNKRLHAGVLFQTLFYSNYNPKKIDLTCNETYHGVGLFLSSNLSNSRNYYTQLYLGGTVATNFSNLIYYPFLGLSQCQFIYPKLQFFISERVSYLINVPDRQNWQPALFGGFKILL